MFHYYGTEHPVQNGDRIIVRSIFGRARLGTVVYVPGQTKLDPELGDDQWAYKTDDGGIYAGGYFPEEVPHTGKRVEFISRAGKDAEEVIRSYAIPPDKDLGQPGRDLLAVIGCATLVLIIFLAVAFAVGWIGAAISN
jgi:hypothetical protein